MTCSYLLHVLAPAERAAVLAEARRLLRPNASPRVVVVTVWAGERRAGRLVARLLALAARVSPGAWGGLRPLDPRADLQAAGFAVTRRIVLPRRGYPSLVLEARPVAQGTRR